MKIYFGVICSLFLLSSCKKEKPIYIQETAIGVVDEIGFYGKEPTITILEGGVSNKGRTTSRIYKYDEKLHIGNELLGEEVIYSYKQCNSFSCDDPNPKIIDIKKK